MRRLEPIWPFCGLNRITHAACSTPLVRFAGHVNQSTDSALKLLGVRGAGQRRQQRGRS